MARLLPATKAAVRPLPSAADLDRLRAGDVANVLQAPSGRDCPTRMLSLGVLAADRDHFVGEVVNDPDCGPTHAGDRVAFSRSNVFSIEKAPSRVERVLVITTLVALLVAVALRRPD